MTFSTSHNMKCTTTPASEGVLAKTECIVQGGDPGTVGKPKQPIIVERRARCGDGNNC